MKFNPMMKSGQYLTVLLATGLTLASAQISRAADFYLKIDGIDGSSTDNRHPKEFEVKSFSWGVSQTDARAGGSGKGKSIPENFSFVVPSSAASPVFFKLAATGKHIPQAVLVCQKSGQSPTVFMRITLKDILISSYKVGGTVAGNSTALDEVEFSYANIEMEAFDQNPNGTSKPGVKTEWNVKTTEITGASALVTPNVAINNNANVVGEQVKPKNNKNTLKDLLKQRIFNEQTNQ